VLEFDVALEALEERLAQDVDVLPSAAAWARSLRNACDEREVAVGRLLLRAMRHDEERQRTATTAPSRPNARLSVVRRDRSGNSSSP